MFCNEYLHQLNTVCCRYSEFLKLLDFLSINTPDDIMCRHARTIVQHDDGYYIPLHPCSGVIQPDTAMKSLLLLSLHYKGEC